LATDDEFGQAVAPGAHPMVLMGRTAWRLAKDPGIPPADATVDVAPEIRSGQDELFHADAEPGANASPIGRQKRVEAPPRLAGCRTPIG
jgi:hypothetical protein